MSLYKPYSASPGLFFRLIALWIFCDNVLGGIIQALHIPFLKLIVPGLALFCICLIGFFCRKTGSVLIAAIVVILFKYLIDPHTPITAYAAVLIQGVGGQALFSKLPYYKLSCVVLGVITLTTSSVLQVVRVSYLYGDDFENFAAVFMINNGTLEDADALLWISFGYMTFHAIAGILLGLLAARMIKLLKKKRNHEWIILNTEDRRGNAKAPAFKNQLVLGAGFMFLLAFIVLYFVIVRVANVSSPLIQVLQILLRFGTVVLGWHLLLHPMILFLGARQQDMSPDNVKALQILPIPADQLLSRSWQLSSTKKGVSRLHLFIKIFILNSFQRRA